MGDAGLANLNKLESRRRTRRRQKEASTNGGLMNLNKMINLASLAICWMRTCGHGQENFGPPAPRSGE